MVGSKTESITRSRVTSESLHLSYEAGISHAASHCSYSKKIPLPGHKAYYTLLCINQMRNKGKEKGVEAKSHFLRRILYQCVLCEFVGSQIN